LQVLKKICRKHGIERWPYREVNAILRRLEEQEGGGRKEGGGRR
jgi:hypothetical protein